MGVGFFLMLERNFSAELAAEKHLAYYGECMERGAGA